MNERNNIRLILMLLAVLLLAGCVSSELIQDPDTERVEGDGRITFREKVGNLTRAENMEDRGHYEFGVWAFKGATPDMQIPGGDVMTDFLVAYGNNSHYTALSDLAETFGGDHGGPDYTVPGDGISSWFYQGLGNNPGRYKQSGGNSIQPGLTEQVLKFWDHSANYYNFFAYAPYYGHQAGVASSALLSESGGQNVLTYDKLSTFYTDPVEQVSSAAQEFAGSYYLNPNYNNEIINANEGLYAAQSVAKANYGKDVPLTFKHMNAKINIAFYEAIEGYKVQLLDLVPETEATAIASSGTLTDDKNLIPASGYNGIALSPATKDQALPTSQKESEVVNPGANLPLPSYYSQAKTIATGVRETATNNAVLSFGTGASDYAYTNANLRFQTPTGNISEIGGAGATVLPTTYYALPNWDGTGYMTQNYTTGYTSMHVAENTGYTLHVTYKLVPQDGAEPDIIYDARVWIAPEYCHWQAGKQYTYVFKITENTNGTTNPYISSDGMFGDGDNDQPYVDPDDPRVPSGAALVPIIFDNVFVTDYESGADIDAALENVLNWKQVNYGGTDYKFYPVLMTPSEYKNALGTHPWSAVSPVLDADYDATNRQFKIGPMAFTADEKTMTPMSGSEIYSHATFTHVEDEFHNDVTAAAKTFWNSTYGGGSIELPAYSMYIWTNDEGTAAEKYTATPNDASKVTVESRVKIMQTTTTYAGYCYMVETKNYSHNPATLIYRYYKADDTEITLGDYNTLKGNAIAASVSPGTTYAYTFFSYTYKVADNGYAITPAPASPLPTKAYGLVKHD